MVKGASMNKNTASSRDVKSSFNGNKKRKRRSTGNQSTYRGGKVDDSYREESDDLKSKTNDPSWYSNDAALLRDAASIPYSWAVGTPIDMRIGDLGSVTLTTRRYVVPGILTLHTMPTFGLSLDKNSPLNVASTAMYSFVRHANSGHSNYAAPDLMIYATAFTQVYSAINWLQRIYGLMNLYSQRNRYLPKALVECQGIDFDSILNNLANFRYGINLAIAKAASFAIPASMSLFQREAFMYQNVYTEGDTVKDQLYLYVPHGFLMYEEDETGSHLNYKTVSSYASVNGIPYQNLLNLVNDMLTPLIGSEDVNIMSGDVLKAYGDSGIIKLASLGESYPVVPIMDKAVLEQMKNSTIMPTAQSLGVFQNTNKEYLLSPVHLTVVESEVKDLIRAHLYKSNRILTTYEYDPTPATTMENSRLMSFVVEDRTYDIDNKVLSYPIVCGSEVVRFCRLWYYEGDTDKARILKSEDILSMNVIDATDAATAYTQLDALRVDLALTSNYHYHPSLLSTTYSTSGDIVNVVGNICYHYDTDNYAIIDSQTCEKLHETALMSMIAVPSIAKFSEAKAYQGR